MRMSFLWIPLGLALCAPNASAQNPALYGDIVVSDQEAFLDLAADFDTTWSLLLNHWGDDAISWPQQALPETWVVVGDLWVRLEGLPYRTGTWTRARVRVGDFQGTDEKGRAEALLYQLAVDLDTLRELEQAATRALAANLATSAVGYDQTLGYGIDPGAFYGSDYPWYSLGGSFAPSWLWWGWPWLYTGYGYSVVNNYYDDDDSYWGHDDYGYGHHGWGGYWWDHGYGCGCNDCGGGNGGGGNGGGNSGGGNGGGGNGGGGGGNGGDPLNPPILSWDGLALADNLPGLTGSYGARGTGKGNGGGSGNKGSGGVDGVGGLGNAGPLTISPGRSVVVRSSSPSVGRRSVALSPLPGFSGGLGTITTSGFGLAGTTSGRGGSSGSSGTGSFGSSSFSSSPSRAISIASSLSRPKPSPGLSTFSRNSTPAVASRPTSRSTPSYTAPSRSSSFRSFGSSSRSTPTRVPTPRAAPARAAPPRAAPSRSTPAPRASGSRSSGSSRSSRASGSSSSRSSSRSTGSSSRGSSSSRSSGRSSSGRGGS